MKFTPYLIAIVLTALFSFRQVPQNVTMATQKVLPVPAISGHKWYLTTLYKKEGFTQLLDRRVFLSVFTERNAAGGNAGCNTYGAGLIMDGENIHFSSIFSTKMYCEEMQLVEDDYLVALRGVTRYEVKANRLFLYAGDRLLLEFESM